MADARTQGLPPYEVGRLAGARAVHSLAGPSCDRVQPGPRSFRILELAPGPEGTRESLLDQVLGVAAVAAEAAGEGEQPPALGVDQPLEGRLVRSAHPPNRP